MFFLKEYFEESYNMLNNICKGQKNYPAFKELKCKGYNLGSARERVDEVRPPLLQHYSRAALSENKS